MSLFQQHVHQIFHSLNILNNSNCGKTQYAPSFLCGTAGLSTCLLEQDFNQETKTNHFSQKSQHEFSGLQSLLYTKRIMSLGNSKTKSSEFVQVITTIFLVAASQLSATHFQTHESRKTHQNQTSVQNNLLLFIKIKLGMNKICTKKI